MCRLFGMNAGRRTAHATYWLEQAPDSMATESHRNPDGAGVGWFDGTGTAHVDKQSVAAYRDPEFRQVARTATATSLITHVRFATVGARVPANTHPFLVDGLIFAHNGGFADLDAVDRKLGPYRDLVKGDTDSERFAALVCQQRDALDGDVAGGIATAARWLAANVPISSLNCLVISPSRLWALRYPDLRSLHAVTRTVTADGGQENSGWRGRSALAGHRITSASGLDPAPVTLVASERVDGHDDWRLLRSGELITVDPDLETDSRIALTDPPARSLTAAGPDPNDDFN